MPVKIRAQVGSEWVELKVGDVLPFSGPIEVDEYGEMWLPFRWIFITDDDSSLTKDKSHGV